ncbi:MAG: D-aminoacyl-tRNA deacylase, partial [Bacteriovoracaceae bacterium]|nr:D-aminoacyl-tRNA deacylase [Bacteriovoracaceae bacterium]
MKVVIQRSGHSKVLVNQEVVGEIRSGLVLLICFEKKDLTKSKKELLEKAKQKILALRIFEDSEGKMNKSIVDISGEVLAISQFTLSWDG